MKLNGWLRYLIFIIIIFLLVFLESIVVRQQVYAYMKSHITNLIIYNILFFLFGLSFGIILGFDHFIKEFKQAPPRVIAQDYII